MKNTKVSVIMPVYNAAEYLRDTMECLINQTLEEIEVICVDDGSTDKSLDILNEYAMQDNRILVLPQKNSLRNKCFFPKHSPVSVLK